MKNLLNDVWSDLRAKRLWPVAVLLLAGLVAVPLVLKKSAEEPPVATVKVEREAPEPKDLKGLATVQLEETRSRAAPRSTPSIRAIRSARRRHRQERRGPIAAGTTAPTADGETTTDGTVAGRPATTSTGGDDGGSGDDGSGDGGDDPTTTTTQYTYVIDVTFTANGRTRKIKGMEKLDMLPNATEPAAALPRCLDQRRQRRLPGRLDPRDGRRGQVQAEQGRMRVRLPRRRLRADLHRRGRQVLRPRDRPDPQGEGRRRRLRLSFQGRPDGGRGGWYADGLPAVSFRRFSRTS